MSCVLDVTWLYNSIKPEVWIAIGNSSETAPLTPNEITIFITLKPNKPSLHR